MHQNFFTGSWKGLDQNKTIKSGANLNLTPTGSILPLKVEKNNFWRNFFYFQISILNPQFGHISRLKKTFLYSGCNKIYISRHFGRKKYVKICIFGFFMIFWKLMSDFASHQIWLILPFSPYFNRIYMKMWF